MFELVRGLRASRVVIGSGRDEVCVTAGDALAERLRLARTVDVGRVTWPGEAASWLKHTERMVSEADAWVLLDHLGGTAQVLHRLAARPGWRPDRTVVWSALARPLLLTLFRPGTLDGLRGTRVDGSIWQVRHGHVHPLDKEHR
ncbi:hypothetical protein [Lentzea sp. NPDC059081]|uniref:hypothetical protein n=1 Tax=Lentzea sp. NPDC059081 TaxID=3346719 RepID=UPI0036C12A30